MGVSENSVPLFTQWLIIIPIKWLFHWEYTLFSDRPIFQMFPITIQWIGFRENLQETMDFPMKYGGKSCIFSLKPIH
jgi:hypothetical protein